MTMRLLSQELLDVQGVMSRLVVMVKQPRFILTPISPLLTQQTKQNATLKDTPVDNLAHIERETP